MNSSLLKYSTWHVSVWTWEDDQILLGKSKERSLNDKQVLNRMCDYDQEAIARDGLHSLIERTAS